MGRGRNGAGRRGRTGVKRSIELPQDVKYFDDSDTLGSQRYVFEADGNKAELFIGNAVRQPVGIRGKQKIIRARPVVFLINDDVDRVRTEGTTGQVTVLKALRAWRHHVAQVPNGTIWLEKPANDDGFGARRASFYKSMGFSKQGTDGYQYAIKRNGKVVPYEVRNG
jgi:hypothetical protein